ncbi:MAG: bifunctional diaminohydroxyphosphoribosylaminopyrimidine deaminase/5-amino-6-(5-phosphoribosylamino)uracil reductase RibD [Candidatus Zhuqueibacterota bacterium]
MTEKQILKKVLQLARKGRGRVSPNPMVGSIIIKDGEIVGQGYHRCFGKDHAEVEALKDAGERAKGATLYVNLEPCCHHGKTPPCTDAIIRAGIKKVVVGMVDPNPLVNQGGIKILRSHGIDVVTGVEEQACLNLNRAFVKYIQTGLPCVTVKFAQTIDGRIATKTGHSQWISSFKSRVEAHRIRSENDAIIVGIHTVKADDPQLTVRHVRGVNPFRIVLDSHLKIPLTSKLLTDEFVSKTIIATIETESPVIDALKQRGAHVWPIQSDSQGRISLPHLLQKIGQARMSSVMVEGGAQVVTSFLKGKLADRIIIAVAPKILGSGIDSVAELDVLTVDEGVLLENVSVKKIAGDLLVSADLKYNKDAK